MELRDEPFLRSARGANGVYLLDDPVPFELLYERTRSAEGRILSDEQVRRLPEGTGLWNASEWRIRERSVDRLLHALQRLEPGARILDVGCGNGWLAAQLQDAGHDVLGIDPFTGELEQAARVFPNGPVFARADPFHRAIPERAFDVVLFAASFQYFPEVAPILERARNVLRDRGEIHILDSILYGSNTQAAAARERSRLYYKDLGVPEMADHYHAHTLASITAAGRVRILSAPSGMDRTLKRFGREASPFSHVVIGQ